jgi:hypothetical protein
MESIFSYVVENTWLQRTPMLDIGWGNGYVLLPQDHPWFGKHYDSISCDVHGGITLADPVTPSDIDKHGLSPHHLGMWCIGFDTCHGGDSLDKWPKSKVIEETYNLYKQAFDAYKSAE